MSINILSRGFSKISGKVPLRTIFIIPFVLQVFAIVGLVGYLSFRNGQKAVNDVATQLQREISDRIQENLQTYLATPHQINQSNATAIRLNQMNLQDVDAWEPHFLEQIKIFNRVSSIVLGNERRGFIGVEVRQDPKLVLMRSDETTGYNLETDAVSTQSNSSNTPPFKRLSTKPNYDPRLRPWYTAAVQAKQPTWSAIFPQFETKNLNLAAVQPVYNSQGKLEGVLNSSLHLIQVGDFLSQLKIGKTGQGFIIDRDGMLVATSTQEKLARLNQDKVERFKATQSSNVLTQATANYLLKTFGNLHKITTVQTLNFSLDSKRQFLQVLPFRDQFGLDWLIVVVVPEADFMGQINANTRTTILLCIAALIVAIGVGILTTRWVVNPILDLNQSAQAFSRGEWEQKVELVRTDEVGQLQESFNRMARQLQESFATLEANNAQMQGLNHALFESERRLTQFLDAMPVGVFVTDAKGKPYYTNRTAKQVLGKGIVESAIAENLQETYQAYLAGSEQLYPKERDPIVNALNGKSVLVDDIEIHRPDKVIPLETSGTPVYDEAGNVAYAIAAFTDITQRKQAEKVLAEYNQTLEQKVEERTQELEQEIAEHRRTEVALLQSETQNRAILSAIPDLMFRVSAEGIYLGYVTTDEFTDLLPSDFDPIGKHIADFLPLDVYSRHLQHLQQALDTKKSQIYEQQHWIEGKVQYEEVRVVVSGENEALFMVRDISDRKQLEKDLSQANQFLDSIVANIPLALFVKDIQNDWRYILWNQAAEKLYGVSQAEAIGCNSYDFVDTQLADHFLAEDLKILEQGTLTIIEEEQIEHKVRGSIWQRFLKAPIYNQQGQATHLLCIGEDITIRKQAEISVRQKNEELLLTLQQLQATQEELIQSEKMAALGQLIAGIAHEINTPLGAIRSSAGNLFKFLEQILEQLPVLFQSFSSEQRNDFFTLVRRSLQQEITFSTKQERQFKKALVRQLEAENIEDAALVADTLVTMGIYQDIDDFLPLFRTSSSSLLLEIAYKLSGLYRSTTTINTATDRASKVVFALKTYARYDSSGKMSFSNLTEGIETVLTLYNNQLKQGVEVIRNYVELPRILCYPDELNQVWTNLIHNALQAMNNRGTLTIDVSQQDDQVHISLTDSGLGIPQEIQSKIFEPFFTTKPPGEGSGLGLDIVKKIIVKHSGQITVESKPGQTTFKVILPIQTSQREQDV